MWRKIRRLQYFVKNFTILYYTIFFADNMILDFKEIPQANGNSGLQDSFELFVRNFLSYLGFIIIEDPDRGADGKRDLIVEEIIHGILKDERKRWLVSCKHYAFSGKAVKDTDESDIRDRLDHYDCSGFILKRLSRQ